MTILNVTLIITITTTINHDSNDNPRPRLLVCWLFVTIGHDCLLFQQRQHTCDHCVVVVVIIIVIVGCRFRWSFVKQALVIIVGCSSNHCCCKDDCKQKCSVLVPLVDLCSNNRLLLLIVVFVVGSSLRPWSLLDLL